MLVRHNQIGETNQDTLALGRGEFGPDAGLEGLASDLHGGIGIGFVGAGDVRQKAPVHGAYAFEGGAALCRAVLAVNECPTFYG
ncbi:hypothetical protein D3C73_1513220 [compost metagenome]